MYSRTFVAICREGHGYVSVGLCFDGAFTGNTGAISTFNSGSGVLIETKHSSRCYELHFSLPACQLTSSLWPFNRKYTSATGSLSARKSDEQKSADVFFSIQHEVQAQPEGPHIRNISRIFASSHRRSLSVKIDYSYDPRMTEKRADQLLELVDKGFNLTGVLKVKLIY